MNVRERRTGRGERGDWLHGAFDGRVEALATTTAGAELDDLRPLLKSCAALGEHGLGRDARRVLADPALDLLGPRYCDRHLVLFELVLQAAQQHLGGLGALVGQQLQQLVDVLLRGSDHAQAYPMGDPDRGCPATAVTNPHPGRSATDEDAPQRDRSCHAGAAVEPDRS